MPTKTIDLLLQLEADKTPSVEQLKKDLAYLEKNAERLKKELGDALKTGDKNAGALSRELAHVESLIKDIDAEAKKQNLAKSLKAAQDQANKTRERMEKLVQVGSRLAMAGAAIVAPFALSVNKYLDAQKKLEANGETMDENARRMVALQERWAASQERIGKVATEILLPYLEKALNLVDKIAAFSEKHPDAVKAALGIGASMVLIGGALSTVGSIVGTLATIQGLFAGAGAAGGTGAITAAISGAIPAILTGITAILASPLTWAVAALALTVPIMNWLLGTNQTWKEIGENGKKALIIIGYGVDKLLRGIGGFFSSMGAKIWDGLVRLATSVVEGVGSAITRLLSLIPGRAEGGYMPTGLYNVSEGGKREFALNNSTTKAAEQMIGGQLTQDRLLSALSGGRRITYNDQRRIDSRLSTSDRRLIRDDIINGLAGAL